LLYTRPIDPFFSRWKFHPAHLTRRSPKLPTCSEALLFSGLMRLAVHTGRTLSPTPFLAIKLRSPFYRRECRAGVKHTERGIQQPPPIRQEVPIPFHFFYFFDRLLDTPPNTDYFYLCLPQSLRLFFSACERGLSPHLRNSTYYRSLPASIPFLFCGSAPGPLISGPFRTAHDYTFPS